MTGNYRCCESVLKVLVPRVDLSKEVIRSRGCLVGRDSGGGVKIGVQIIFSNLRSENKFGKMMRSRI